jgi:hypothetical protein
VWMSFVPRGTSVDEFCPTRYEYDNMSLLISLLRVGLNVDKFMLKYLVLSYCQGVIGWGIIPTHHLFPI